MERSGAAAYVYAKASGTLARSFIGERAAQLFSARSLAELWALLFKTEVPAVPEAILAKRLEEAAHEKLISDYKNILDMYDSPDKVAVMLLQYFDYSNLKSLGAASAMKQKDAPGIHDISPYNILDYGAWPSMQKITAGTTLSWYNKEPDVSEQHILDAHIDSQFLLDLWKACYSLPARERKPVEDLLLKKYAMKNVIWVLRLKVYYKMSADEIIKHISFLDRSKGGEDLLAHDAMQIVNKAPDHYEDWRSWKYAKFLNPHEEGALWSIDPNWVQDTARKDLMWTATHKFHRYPFTPTVIVCWIFIKLIELDYIRAAVEALRLNVDADTAMVAAGIK